MTWQPWRKQAACRFMDTDIWFPASTSANAYDDAYAICKECPVTNECLEYGIASDSLYGMFGGLRPFERRLVQKGIATVAELRAGKGIPHGTEAGFYREQRRGITPCDACRSAANEAARKRRYRKRVASSA